MQKGKITHSQVNLVPHYVGLCETDPCWYDLRINVTPAPYEVSLFVSCINDLLPNEIQHDSPHHIK